MRKGEAGEGGGEARQRREVLARGGEGVSTGGAALWRRRGREQQVRHLAM